MLAHKRNQLRRVAALPDNLKARPLKQARETLAEENIIFCQRNPSRVCGHGNDYRPSLTCRSTPRYRLAVMPEVKPAPLNDTR